MNKNYYERWCEIQFFHIGKKLYEKSNDLRGIDHLATVLKLYKDIDTTAIKEAFITMVNNNYCYPSKDETALLCYHFKHPIVKTKKILVTCNKYYYAVIENHKKDPMGIYPKVKDERLLKNIINFIEAYQLLKGEMFE